MSSYLTRNKKFQKNRKKIQKIRKHHYGFFSSQNRSEKAGKERKKKLSIRSVPTRRVIENSQKIAKKFKKLKNSVMPLFESKVGRKRPGKRENRNYRSVLFLPDA